MRLTEKQLITMMHQNGMVTEISQLSEFPWTNYSFAELVKLVEDNKIIMAVLYDPDARYTVLSRGEKLFSDLIGLIIFLIPILFIIMAIYFKEWLFLLSIPFTLISLMVSNPWAIKIRKLLMIITTVIIILTVLMSYYYFALICVGFFLTIYLAVFAREYVNNVVKKEIKKSEALFCYTYQTGLLLLKDQVTDEIYKQREFSK
jgi:hypothetical protein